MTYKRFGIKATISDLAGLWLTRDNPWVKGETIVATFTESEAKETVDAWNERCGNPNAWIYEEYVPSLSERFMAIMDEIGYMEGTWFGLDDQINALNEDLKTIGK